MTTAVLMIPPFLQFADSTGKPYAGGTVKTYAAGTTTPLATYTDATAATPAANPIVLDSAGRCQIWGVGSYRFDVFDVNGNLVDSTDNIISYTIPSSAGNPLFDTFSGDASTTVFTLSQSAGTISKELLVWVDAGAGKGYEIQNPNSYTVSGTSLTFGSAPASGTNNIFVTAPNILANSAAASAAAAAGSASSSAADAVSTAADKVACDADKVACDADVVLCNAAVASVFKDHSAAAAPTVNNDTTQGYAAGSIWYDTATSTAYLCSDASTGAAVWNSVTQTVPVKASGAELDTGTDDAKFATAKALKDSHNVPSLAPTNKALITGNGTDWVNTVLYGTSANNLVQLDASAKLPAVDGSALTNLPIASELVLLATATAASSSTLDFTSLISSAYSHYIFVFSEVINSTGSSTWGLYGSTDNGATWAATFDYQQEFIQMASSAPLYAGGTAASPAVLTKSQNQGHYNGFFDLYIGSVSGGGTGLICNNQLQGVDRPTIQYFTQTINAIRFAISTGTFTSGKIYMYGVKNT
jgi:hypothetical protein